MKWTVAKAEICDAAIISAFQLAMAEESEGTSLNPDILRKGVEAVLEDASKGSYFVVRAESGETAGSLMVTKEWSDWNNCSYWWIQSVYVKPEYRGQGAFRALYAEVRRRAVADGSTCLRLYVDRTNFKAQECYHKLGMDECHYLMYEQSFK